MKNKILKSLLMFVIAMAFVFNIINFNTASANADTMTLQQKIEKFTSSDEVTGYENTDIKVKDYPSQLYRKVPNTYDHSNNKVTINGDNPIIGIIPRELFMQEIKKFYLGKEYGFYIYTFKEPYQHGTPDENKYVNNGNMHSLVMVFDLQYSYNDILNTTEFSLKINPLFQYEFKYLKKNDKNITGVALSDPAKPLPSKISLNTFKSSYNSKLNYSFANNINDAVIASPFVVPGDVYLEKERELFYLKDFQLVTNLENTRTKNRLDSGYNVLDDKGSFFYQTAIGGFGKQLKGDAIQNLNDTFAMAGLIMSLVGCTVDPSGLAFSSLVATVANMTTSAFLNPYVDDDNMVVSQTHNNTAAAQISAYQKLIKASYMKLSTDNDGKNLGYSSNNHYIKASYKMNNSTGSGMPIETLIRSIIGLKISGIYFSECDAELETTWTERINKANSNEKQVSLGTQRLYVLCNYENEYTFYNSENRYLNFSATNGLNFEIFDENGNLKDKNSLFEAGKTYKIKITNLTRNTYTDFNISLKSFNLSDNYNADIIIPSGYATVKFKGTGIYNVNLIGNAKIALIDKSGNAVNYNRFNATNADFHSNGDIYITFYNPTADNVNISLKFVTVKDTVSLGDSTLNPQSINNYKFYKLNLDYTKSYYFNLTYSTGMSPGFVFYDSSFKEIFPVSGAMLGANSSSFAFNHTQGIVYMGISAKSGSHSLNIESIGDSGEWYINDKKASAYTLTNNRVSLKRGFKATNAEYLISYRLLNGQCLNGFSLSTATVAGVSLSTMDKLILNNKTTINGAFSVKYKELELNLIAVHEGLGNITLTKDIENSCIKVNLENINDVSKIVYSFNGKNYNVEPKNTDAELSYTFIVDLGDLYALTDIKATIVFKEYVCNNYIYELKTSKTITLFFAGGDGSIFNRLKISNEEDLNAMRYYSTNQFELVNDIILKNNWTPIQNFRGSLNGNNYNIHDLTIDIDNTPGTYYGLFGYLPSASKVNIIQKVHLKNIKITGSTIHDANYIFVGGIAGLNLGQISGCSVTGKIEVHRNNSAVGGIVGRNESNLTSCSFGNNSYSRSTLKGNGDIGGIAGQTTYKISLSNVYNTYLDIYIVSRNRSMGGIVGIAYNATISTCVADNIFMICSNSYGTTGIYPKMGYIAGTMENGSIYKVGGINLSHNTSNISTPYKVDTFNGPWGVYGKCIGTVSIT